MMKKILCIVLVISMVLSCLFSLTACFEEETPGDPEEVNSGETVAPADPTDSGEEQQEQVKRRNGIRFYSEEQAEPIMEHGLSELQGYLRADKTGEYTGRILAKYYNNYLIPYTEMLAEKQVVAEPGSVASNWWPEGSVGMSSRLDTSLANAYRKMAQDMLPYMLPDPDELLQNLALKFGGNADVDRKLDKEQMMKVYESYLDNWDFWHNGLLVSDWGTFWEDNLYLGETYALNGVTVSFSSPRYNKQMLVNVEVYGTGDEEHREAFLPYSTASNLLTEIQEARSHGTEYYIQNIGIGVTGRGEADALNSLWEVFKICFPHADEDELRVRFNEVKDGETKHVFIYSQDYVFRFNKYLNYLADNDYSFVMPSFGKYDGAQTRFDGAGYLVDINDWYTNGTCDSYMKIGITNNGYDSETELCSYVLKIEIGGKDCIPTNLYRDIDIFYAVNYQVQYGVYYAILAPFYYSEAVNSGFFTPYVIPEFREESEGDIPLIPEYPQEKKRKTLTDVVGDGTSEPVKEKAETRWLREGFGDEFKFPERRKELPDADLSGLGYTKNSDGTWTRTMQVSDLETSHKLYYDEKGVLTGGYRSFVDGTYKTMDYATDVNFNPIMSIDKYYDAGGTQTDVAITKYDAHSSKTIERTFYEGEVRPGEVDNFKKQTIHFDNEGGVADRTFYKDNKIASRYYVNTIENTIGTYGDMRTEYVKTVTTDVYSPDGSIVDTHSETVVTTEEKAEAQNAVQNYLEKVTGVKRDR